MRRTWKTNIYGNTVGYVGTSRDIEFGCHSYSERWAAAWANGLSKEDALDFALGNPEFRDFSKERK